MSPTLKKILLIIALVIVAGLILFGIFYFFRSTPIGQRILRGTPSTSTPQLPQAPVRTSTLPSNVTPDGGQLPIGTDISSIPTYYQPKPVNQITSDQALFSSLGTNGNLRYHNIADGKFYQVLPNGAIKELSDQVFYNVKNATWAKNKNQAVLEFPDESKIVYNFDTKKQVTIPKHWEDFSFSSDGNELAAKSVGLSPENRWLVVTNDDGSGTRLIEPIGNNVDKIHVDWSPSRQTLAFSQIGGEPLGLDRREVLLVGTQGENLKSLIIEGLDFIPQWSPTGQKLLYSVDSARTDFKPELWIVNAYGDNIGSDRRTLNLNTWADKCSFGDDNTLFCAVPKELPQGAGINPEINTSPDDLYKIDLKSGTKIPVSLGDDNYRIHTISYDKEQNKVFFTDRSRPGVFEVKL